VAHRLLAAAVLLLPSSLAQAQTRQAVQEPSAPSTIVAATTVIEEGDFQELQIDGQLVSPHLALATERGTRAFPSWVQVRRSFNDRLAASVAEID